MRNNTLGTNLWKLIVLFTVILHESKAGTIPSGKGEHYNNSLPGLFEPTTPLKVTLHESKADTIHRGQGLNYNKSLPGLFEPTTMGHNSLPFMINCTLTPEFNDVGDTIAELVTSGYKLVRIDLLIQGHQGPLGADVRGRGDMYNPYNWIVLTGNTEKALFLLKDNFDAMSLQTLGYGVGNINVSILQKPLNCMAIASAEQVMNSIRKLILTNFGSKTRLPIETTSVCSRHVDTDTRTVDENLFYRCCDMTVDHEMICSPVQKSLWLRLLFFSIVLMQLMVILYCPLILPESLYSSRKLFTEYIYEPGEDERLVLKVKKVINRNYLSTRFENARLHSTARLTNFQHHLKYLRPNISYILCINKMIVSVRTSKLLTEGSAPAGVLDFVKRFFCQCRMRQEVKSVSDCCNQDMCNVLPIKKVCYWHTFLQMLMMLVMAGMVCVPWIIRVWFYYAYEQAPLTVQKITLEARNMTMPYMGNVVSYLSPTHGLFIFIYMFLPIVCICYGFMPGSMKQKLKFTVWKCFSDMRAIRTGYTFGIFTSHLLWPLSKFGIVGCVVLPLWMFVIPLSLVLLAIEVLPIVNLTFRYIVNFVYYSLKIVSPGLVTRKGTPGKLRTWLGKRLGNIIITNPEDGNQRGSTTIHAFALGITLVTMWLVIFLATECLSFFVECAVYTLIGFILNPARVMRLLSVVMLIGVYGHESFTGVQKSYETYCKAIHTQIQGLFEDKMSEIAKLPEEKQDCVAFRVQPVSRSSKEERIKLVIGSEGHLKWKAPRLVLFFHKEDIPYIPKRLLFETANLKHFYCPGQMHMLYLYALLDFAKILVFLLFVFIVIFAFGQTNNVSAGGQSMAALGSGFAPLFLRKLLFQTPEISKTNLRWYGLFMDAVEEYADRWHPVDIHVSELHEAHEIADTAEAETSDSVNDDSYDVTHDLEKETTHNNGDVAFKQMHSFSIDTLGSETLLPEYFKPDSEVEEDVDLIVLFNDDITGSESVEYFLPKKAPKLDKEDIAVHIKAPFNDEETV